MNSLYVLKRILRQFGRDRRTLALVFVVPILIMSVFYLLFSDDLESGIRVGVHVRGEETAFVAELYRELSELKPIRFTRLGDGDLEAAVDRLGLDAALELPETLQSDIIRKKAVSYRLLLEGTRPGAGTVVENVVKAATLGALAHRLPLLVPQIAFTPEVSYRHLSESYRSIDLVSPPFIAFFLYFISFLLTCVAFLRERASGTLERVFVTPIRSAELVLGYLFAFFALSGLQSLVLLLYCTYVLHIKTAVGIGVAFVPIMLTVLVGVTMGIFFSTLARNEFQVIQFIPIVIIPQGLLCGLLFEIDSTPLVLRVLARGMPLTYTTDILKDVLLRARPLAAMWQDFLFLLGFLVVFFLLSLLAVRRSR